MSAESLVKIQMLRGSLRCFVFGLFGLIPFIGLAFAIMALWLSGRIRAQEKVLWNAGRIYRVWGMGFAAFSAVVWSGIFMLILFRLLS